MRIGIIEFTAALTVLSLLFGAWLHYLDRRYRA